MSTVTEQELRALGTWTSRGGGTLWVDECTEDEDRALNSLLNKQEPYKGVVYRGLHDLEKDYFKVGGTWSPGIKTSWSASKEVAEEYCDGYFGRERYLLVVENESYGRFVSHLGTLEFSEDEVITVSNAGYTVKSVTPGKVYTTVELSE